MMHVVPCWDRAWRLPVSHFREVWKPICKAMIVTAGPKRVSNNWCVSAYVPHELKAPWSELSLQVLNSKLRAISAPPPNPSLKFLTKHRSRSVDHLRSIAFAGVGERKRQRVFSPD